MKAVPAFILSGFLLICSWPLQAGIQLNGTRIIYPEGRREVTLGLTNHADTPRLLQTWIDAGDDRPHETVPFIVTPPIFRLDPDKGHTLRIIYTGGALPADRESVFWLNVLELQPKPARQADRNNIKVTIRTRLKLFFRPKGLPGSPKEVVTQLRWRLVQDGKSYAVACENPTPWNVSFNHVGMKNVSLRDEEKQSGMCPAKGTAIFPLTGTAEKTGRLTLITIDDFGGYHDSEAAFSR